MVPLKLLLHKPVLNINIFKFRAFFGENRSRWKIIKLENGANNNKQTVTFFSKLSKSLVNYQCIGNTFNYQRESLAFANFFRLTTVKRTSLRYTTYRL